MKKYLIALGVAIAIAALGFAFGRYSAPTQIKEIEKIKVVTVEKKVEKAVEKKDVKVVVTEKPDGTKITETTDLSTTTTDTNTDTNTNSTTDKTKITTFKKPNWRIGAIAGLDIHTSSFSAVKPVYGALVERRILGPISVGGMGMSNGTFGIVLSVEF